jgi:hypothetical protein
MLRPRAMFPSPPIITLPSELPDDVESEAEAAFKLFWSDLGASASRLRTSVERVLDHFNIPATKAGGGFLTLNDRIKEFKKIDTDHADTFDALRHVGNVGTHLLKIIGRIVETILTEARRYRPGPNLCLHRELAIKLLLHPYASCATRREGYHSQRSAPAASPTGRVLD